MSTPTPAGPASPQSRRPVPSANRLFFIAGSLALFAAAMWFAWLGWDHTYYEVNGVAQGPYRAWQVIGCALSIGTGAVLAYRLVASLVAAIVVLATAADVGFAVPWAINASASDETGLWVVGLFMLVVGGSVALTLVLAITHMFHRP